MRAPAARRDSRAHHPPGQVGALSLLLLLLLLLALETPSASASASASAGEAGESLVEMVFFQEMSFPKAQAADVEDLEDGQFQYSFEGEEIFHVDWVQKKAFWRLPNFPSYFSVETEVALNILSSMKNTLEEYVDIFNRTPAQNAAPSATLYPKDPVELGEPNILICFVDKFCPPVLNITWMKNGEEVSEGVQETGFYPSADNTLSKVSYLPFIPEDGDFYVCQVDHWGLQKPLIKIWYAKEATPPPETTENILCGLGLAIGILGIITGTVLFCKAMRMNDHNSRNRGGL